MTAAACKLAPAKPIVDEKVRRDELVTDHLPLVRAIALSMQKSLPVHIELDDLIHAGVMGLLDAATKYSEEKQVAFRTYAQYRIRGAILDGLRQQDCAPRELRRRFKQVETAGRTLTTILGRSPVESEIAAALGIELSQLMAWRVEFRVLATREARVEKDDASGSTVPDVPAAAADCPDHILGKRELQQKLKLAMLSLPGRHRQVVELYYQGDHTMREIGEKLGVNESRVSQLHKAALCRLQKALAESGVTSSAAFC